MTTNSANLMRDLSCSMNAYFMKKNEKEIKNTLNPLVKERMYFLMNRQREAVRVYPEDIVYLKACRSYCDVYFKDGNKMTTAMAMGNVIIELNHHSIFRLSRFSAVNTSYIKSIMGNLIKTTTGIECQVTESYKEEFHKLKKVIA